MDGSVITLMWKSTKWRFEDTHANWGIIIIIIRLEICFLFDTWSHREEKLNENQLCIFLKMDVSDNSISNLI